MKLVFVRHGEPDYENDSLTENGVEQARKTAERLKNEGISAVYSSPMGRAMKTAFFTAELLGLTVEPLDFMHEIDWDSHPWTTAFRLLTEKPEMMVGDGWRDSDYFRGDICLKYYDMIAQEFDRFLENFGLVRNGSLYEQTNHSEQTIALFAHGGSGAVMFSHLLNLSFPYVLTALPYGVCSVSILEFDAKIDGKVIPRLELFNDMNHLDNVKFEPLHFDK
ncbi:probable phosphoglycerate mutase [Lachnospiraceae bacterium NE2001]|nr:probable phosphoglycerate mutase [Lachnospiraceae bacterium NE2001]